MVRSDFCENIGFSSSMVLFLAVCLLVNVAVGQGGGGEEGGGGGGGMSGGSSGDSGSGNGDVNGDGVDFGIVLAIVIGVIILVVTSIYAMYKGICCLNRLSAFRKEYLERKRVDMMSEEDFDNIANNFRSLIT